MSHLKLQKLQDSAYWWLFLLCMVNITGFLPHKIPKYTNTNTIYFDWRSTILWLRSIFKQYFDDWLVSSKQQAGIFLRQKNQITAQTRKEPYIYDFHIVRGRGRVFKCVTCLQILFVYFLNKRSIVQFCRWRELWVTQLVIFCWRHKCMTPKWFKITTNSVIRGNSFFFNFKPDRF